MKKKKQNQKNFKKSFKSLSIFQKILLIIGLLIMTIMAFPIVIVLFIGLLPSLTIFITDPKNTNKIMIVGCFNLAGVFVYLMNVINHFSISGAMFILSDIFNLIIMLGSAALGLIIYCEIPNLFLILSKISAKRRLKIIESNLEKLSEEWGAEVINNQISK